MKQFQEFTVLKIILETIEPFVDASCPINNLVIDYLNGDTKEKNKNRRARFIMQTV